MSKIRWSRSHNAAADLIVHARTTSIHPPISAVHPEFDKSSTCINASIRPATGTRCGPGRPIAAELNLVVLMFVGARMRHKYFRYVAQVSLPRHRAQLGHPTPRAVTATLDDRAATLRSRLRRQRAVHQGGRPECHNARAEGWTVNHGKSQGFCDMDLNWPAAQWLSGRRVRSGHGPWAPSHGFLLCYPPAGGRGITACRNPYFTT